MIEEYNLNLNCYACPEQYDLVHQGKIIAYFRLRWGVFKVTVPDVGGVLIYETQPRGHGIFEEEEREFYLRKAIEKVAEYYGHNKVICSVNF